MIIKTLAENTSLTEDFGNEHGLSLYIETKGHKILFDVGASDLFLQNARKLGVNISDVDFLVISHGHYDHGGGLEAFFQENHKAKVYIHQKAFERHAVLFADGKIVDIGLKEELKENKQLVFIGDNYIIDQSMFLFSNANQKYPQPSTNKGLVLERQGQIIEDSSEHEQNLVIEEDGKILLLTGCAHNGIINIVEQFHIIRGRMPDYVIGGFHLSTSIAGDEAPETIDKISKYLLDTGAKYYTCHCTGLAPYERLKKLMGDKVEYLSTSRIITI